VKINISEFRIVGIRFKNVPRVVGTRRTIEIHSLLQVIDWTIAFAISTVSSEPTRDPAALRLLLDQAVRDLPTHGRPFTCLLFAAAVNETNVAAIIRTSWSPLNLGATVNSNRSGPFIRLHRFPTGCATRIAPQEFTYGRNYACSASLRDGGSCRKCRSATKVEMETHIRSGQQRGQTDRIALSKPLPTLQQGQSRELGPRF